MSKMTLMPQPKSPQPRSNRSSKLKSQSPFLTKTLSSNRRLENSKKSFRKFQFKSDKQLSPHGLIWAHSHWKSTWTLSNFQSVRSQRSILTLATKANHTSTWDNSMKMARNTGSVAWRWMAAISTKDNSRTICTMDSAGSFTKTVVTSSENTRMAWGAAQVFTLMKKATDSTNSGLETEFDI